MNLKELRELIYKDSCGNDIFPPSRLKKEAPEKFILISVKDLFDVVEDKSQNLHLLDRDLEDHFIFDEDIQEFFNELKTTFYSLNEEERLELGGWLQNSLKRF